ARVAFADMTIDGEGRDDLMALQNRHEPPEANPHPALVPGPVRNVRDQRLPHWWRQYGARMRSLDTPLFDIDDHPNRHTRAVRQNELRAVDDSLVGQSIAEQRHVSSHILPQDFRLLRAAFRSTARVPFCRRILARTLHHSSDFLEHQEVS